MSNTFVTTMIVIVIAILIATIIMLALDLNKKDREMDAIENKQSAYETQLRNQTEFNAQLMRNINDLNERLSVIEENINGIRADAQRTILAECAKFGLRPTDYVAKHAKIDTPEGREHAIPSFAKADPDKEYIVGHNEDNAAQFEAFEKEAKHGTTN